MSRLFGFSILLASFCGSFHAGAQTNPVVLKSPDGALEISIGTQADGQLGYRVSFHDKPVLDWSKLGLDLQGLPPLGPAVQVQAAETSTHDESWSAPHGKNNPIRDHFNAVVVHVLETGGRNPRRLDIEARTYDDGVAFRYLIPEQPTMRELRIAAELTQFRLSKDSTTTFPLILRDYRTPYEDDYHELPIGGLHPSYLIALPLLMEVPGVAWVGLTEAYIDNYAGLYVSASAHEPRTLEARLAPRVDEPGLAVSTQTPARSPWRVLMIGAEAGRLVESNLVANLNPPSEIVDVSWIKPGKTAWNWWSGSVARNVSFKTGMNTETIKHYIDFSAKSKLEYMLIDAGWALAGTGSGNSGSDLTKTSKNIDMPELLEYAKSRNVRLWLWAHWTEIDRQVDEAFPLFEKWGIAGVKIDFMDRDDQWMVNWYRRIAKNAAAHKLMLDYHGAFKPDGIGRTWPNVLTREGVMGLEYSKWSGRVTPKHNVTLAFTRMLAGPLDYTPGGFNNVTKAEFVPRNAFPMVMATRAHETALYVVFESPFQMLADFPESYEDQKELDFLKAVPATWDETHVVNGQPARYITIARRRGKEWFLGSITDWDAREVQASLSFLGSGSYTAEIYADAPDAATSPKNTVRERRQVDAHTVLTLKLAPGGGCAVRFTPAP